MHDCPVSHAGIVDVEVYCVLFKAQSNFSGADAQSWSVKMMCAVQATLFENYGSIPLLMEMHCSEWHITTWRLWYVASAALRVSFLDRDWPAKSDLLIDVVEG